MFALAHPVHSSPAEDALVMTARRSFLVPVVLGAMVTGSRDESRATAPPFPPAVKAELVVGRNVPISAEWVGTLRRSSSSFALAGLGLGAVRFFSPLGPFSGMNDVYGWGESPSRRDFAEDLLSYRVGDQAGGLIDRCPSKRAQGLTLRSGSRWPWAPAPWLRRFSSTRWP